MIAAAAPTPGCWPSSETCDDEEESSGLDNDQRRRIAPLGSSWFQGMWPTPMKAAAGDPPPCGAKASGHHHRSMSSLNGPLCLPHAHHRSAVTTVRLQSGRMLGLPPQHGAWKPSCTRDIKRLVQSRRVMWAASRDIILQVIWYGARQQASCCLCNCIQQTQDSARHDLGYSCAGNKLRYILDSHHGVPVAQTVTGVGKHTPEPLLAWQLVLRMVVQAPAT